MSKLDPQLEFLADDGVARLEAMDAPAELARYGVQVQKKKRGASAAPPVQVDILVQFAGDPAALEAAGMTVRAVAGDVVSGSIAIGSLPDLAGIAQVDRVESSRALYPELDLATADSRVDDVQTGPPGYRGSGVIVGIVDSGIDYTHESFRKASGQTRILRIWDQALAPAAGETQPAGFGYGVEYTAGQIDAALAAADPFQVVRHRDPDSNRHGTHVTGIAAGDGSAPGQGQPAGTFAGVATDADIIVVGNVGGNVEGLGNSSRALEAVAYIFQQATALGRPCVINMSLGDNLGPHDGTALLERGIDNLLGGPGRALVKSAGNAAADRIHAQGTVATGATVDVRFTQPANDASTNQMDLWYDGADTFTVTVVDPAGGVAGPVSVGANSEVTLAGGNIVRVSHRDNDPHNGDKRAFLTFAPGAAGTMQAGTWTLRLTSVGSPSGGRFDAWIQRGQVIPQFLAPHESPERTISTPGTAHEVITAASHITRGAGVGARSSFSSRGPTRDGRLAPTISAPGEWIISARGHAAAGQDPYVQLAGTSMAAPHVAGAVALLLQKSPTLTAAQLAQVLSDNARTDAFTGATPNTAWGAGKLDLLGAFPPPIVPVTVVEPWCRPTLVGTPWPRTVITPNCTSVPVFRCPTVLKPDCLKLESVPKLQCPPPISVVSPCHSVPQCIDPTKIPSLAAPCQSVPQCIDPTKITTLVDPTIPFGGGLKPGVVYGGPGGPGGGFRGQDAAYGGRDEQNVGAPSRVGCFATVFGPVCPSDIGSECPQIDPGLNWPTQPWVDCPPPPVTVPGYDCPPPTQPWVDCPPPTLPWTGCPTPTSPRYGCPPQTIPSMDCPTVLSVPGRDCPIWWTSRVGCGVFNGPVWADPTAGGRPQPGAGDAGRAPGGPGSGLPGCGFGVSSPVTCTWWSVPDVNCGVKLPTIAVDCPSLLPTDCLSQVLPYCPPPRSVPPRVCQSVPMPDCWAPTTAPGCEIPSSLRCPSRLGCPSRICTTAVTTTAVNPAIFGGGLIGGGDASARGAGGGAEGASTSDRGTAAGMPDQGFYDYDESWWD